MCEVERLILRHPSLVVFDFLFLFRVMTLMSVLTADQTSFLWFCEVDSNYACGANYHIPGWFNYACGANYPYQALKGGLFCICVESANLTWLVPSFSGVRKAT